MALDSIPQNRRAVIDALYERPDASTNHVAEITGYPSTTARRTLEDLRAHGVVYISARSEGREHAHRWDLVTDARATWGRIRGVPEIAQHSKSEERPRDESVAEQDSYIPPQELKAESGKRNSLPQNMPDAVAPDRHAQATELVLDAFPGSEVVPDDDPVHELIDLAEQERHISEWNASLRRAEDA